MKLDSSPVENDGATASAQLIQTYGSRSINVERLAALRSYAGCSILDAGCGNGNYVLELAKERDIYGVDIHPFARWQVTPDRFSVHDVTSLPHAENSVETVCSFEVLEHLPNPEFVLRDFLRICSKNVILTVPNCELTPGMRQSLLTYFHYTDRTHVNFFTLEELSRMCERVGFRIVHQELINEVSPEALIREVYGLSGLFGRVLMRLLRMKRCVSYHLTCLIVAEKPA